MFVFSSLRHCVCVCVCLWVKDGEKKYCKHWSSLSRLKWFWLNECVALHRDWLRASGHHICASLPFGNLKCAAQPACCNPPSGRSVFRISHGPASYEFMCWLILHHTGLVCAQSKTECVAYIWGKDEREKKHRLLTSIALNLLWIGGCAVASENNSVCCNPDARQRIPYILQSKVYCLVPALWRANAHIFFVLTRNRLAILFLSLSFLMVSFCKPLSNRRCCLRCKYGRWLIYSPHALPQNILRWFWKSVSFFTATSNNSSARKNAFEIFFYFTLDWKWREYETNMV